MTPQCDERFTPLPSIIKHSRGHVRAAGGSTCPCTSPVPAPDLTLLEEDRAETDPEADPELYGGVRTEEPERRHAQISLSKKKKERSESFRPGAQHAARKESL